MKEENVEIGNIIQLHNAEYIIHICKNIENIEVKEVFLDATYFSYYSFSYLVANDAKILTPLENPEYFV